MGKTSWLVLAAACVLGSACGEAKKSCSVMFKGQPLFTVNGKLWAFPEDTCRGIAKAIAESSEGTRTDLFGMGAETATTPLPCVCE